MHFYDGEVCPFSLVLFIIFSTLQGNLCCTCRGLCLSIFSYGQFIDLIMFSISERQHFIILRSKREKGKHVTNYSIMPWVTGTHLSFIWADTNYKASSEWIRILWRKIKQLSRSFWRNNFVNLCSTF